MAFDSFTSNWQVVSLHKMSTFQMMFGANLFCCLFLVWSMIDGGHFYQQCGLWRATLSLLAMPQHCHWLQRQDSLLFLTPYSLLGQLCLPSSWPLEWCWVSCFRTLLIFIITHCLLKLFWGLLPCVCMLDIDQNHLPRSNCLYQDNVIRKECWLTLLITADHCLVMVLNFFQQHSLNLSVNCTRMLKAMRY